MEDNIKINNKTVEKYLAIAVITFHIPCSSKPEKARVTILIKDKVEIMTKNIIRDKKE